jgi:hypothetical protein
MASANCQCCSQPTTVPNTVTIVSYACVCGCDDCDTCEECFHECECGDCVDCGYYETPAVLCHFCHEGRECDPRAWHCDGRTWHSCDGTACEEHGER